MDLIIAILFFLNILVPGTTYTQTDLDAIIIANQTQIMQVEADPAQVNAATTSYTTSVQQGLIEPWEDEREPIGDGK